MEEQAKPFGLVDTILLSEIAITADAANIVTSSVMLFPVIGQIVLGFDKVLDLGVSSIIIGVFVFKTRSFGAAGMVEVAGSIASAVGIPAQTIAVWIGMYLVNHPKLAAAVAATSGTGAVAAEKTGLREETTITTETRATTEAAHNAGSETKPEKTTGVPPLQDREIQPLEEPQGVG